MSSELPQGLIEGILIGVIVSVVGQLIQFSITELKERRREQRLTMKQRAKAYVRLYAILERHGANPSTTVLSLSTDEFSELQSAVEDNYEVLYETTLEEWRKRKVTTIGILQHFAIEAGPFFGDIRVHYERLDKRNPYHHLDIQ